jgi:hypothetical protein
MVEEFYDEIGDPPKVGWRSQYRLAPKDPFRPIGKGNAQWLVTTKNPDIKPAVQPPDLIAARAAWERLKGEDTAAKEWPSAWLDSFRDFIYDIGRSTEGDAPLTLAKVDSKKPHAQLPRLDVRERSRRRASLQC